MLYHEMNEYFFENKGLLWKRKKNNMSKMVSIYDIEEQLLLFHFIYENRDDQL